MFEGRFKLLLRAPNLSAEIVFVFSRVILSFLHAQLKLTLIWQA